MRTILEIRQRLGWTRAKFARELEVSFHDLVDYESEDSLVPPDVKQKINDFYANYLEERRLSQEFLEAKFPRKRTTTCEDLKGQRFNELEVLERDWDYINPKTGQRFVQWLCRCSCGNYITRRASALKSGKAKSCGCLRKASNKDLGLLDLTGQSFGQWTVLKRDEDFIDSSGRRSPMWLCECFCGVKRLVAGGSLRNGESESCGCSKSLKVEFAKQEAYPKRAISRHGQMRRRGLSGSPANLSHIAKYYQFPVFYSREIALWEANDDYKGQPLQEFIYKNRKRYVNKDPHELTDFQLMRGMTIAGVMKGYTVFNTRLMDEMCEKYGVTSIYDPCSGWGERALYCHYHNIDYIGVDINEALFSGYKEMAKDFGMNSVFIHGDSAWVEFYDQEVDMVFTCPPYFDTEIYSLNGIENYTYREFLAWWRRVVLNSLMLNPDYFAFQINQKYKEDMQSVVESCGFVFLEELQSGIIKSHLTPTKREFESLLVFGR